MRSPVDTKETAMQTLSALGLLATLSLTSGPASMNVLAPPAPRVPAALEARIAAAKVRRPFDHPGEAQEFFLRQRLPPGETSLTMDRYFQARAKMLSMRQH